MNIFLLLLVILVSNPTFSEKRTNTDNKNNPAKKQYNEKTFSSGPMGIGLTKSYYTSSYKVCIYSTVTGQKKIKLENKLSICPSDFPK